MDAAAFLVALRKRAPAAEAPHDPLADARRLLAQDAETAERRALRRVIQALANSNGTFAETDVWLFSAETLGLVSALIDARLNGRYQEEEWQRACH
jgi:hypothetical protein